MELLESEIADSPSEINTDVTGLSSCLEEIRNDHLNLVIPGKRLQCMWVVAQTKKRCANITNKVCSACKFKGQPFRLCGKHMEDHRDFELQKTLQDLQ